MPGTVEPGATQKLAAPGRLAAVIVALFANRACSRLFWNGPRIYFYFTPHWTCERFLLVHTSATA
jgi:hypothetical protein